MNRKLVVPGGSVKGKVVLITGPTNGIGRATAFALAEAGATLFLLCRSQVRGETMLKEIEALYPGVELHLLIADLGAPDQVRRAAEQFLQMGQPLHLLINNAGLINTERRILDSGQEQMFAVNHLGHFLLTCLLLDRIKSSAPARIINVSSGAHSFCKEINFDDLSWQHDFATFKVYGHSKLANILFTKALAERLKDSKVSVNALHPGAVASELGRQNGMLAKFVFLFIKPLLRPFFKSPLQGAQTTLYLASSAEVEGISGRYFADCKIIKEKPWATDEAAAERLWAVSEDLMGLSS